MNTGADPIERLIQQADLIRANAQHGAQRRQEAADRAERDGNEAGRLAALAFVAMYQEQQEGAQRLADRLRCIRSAAARRRKTSTATRHVSTVSDAHCTVDVWLDGTYRAPCGYLIVKGACLRHGNVSGGSTPNPTEATGSNAPLPPCPNGWSHRSDGCADYECEPDANAPSGDSDGA